MTATQNSLQKTIDWGLLILTYLTAIFGIVILYSATRGDGTAYYKTQMVWLGLASFALGAGTLINYRSYGRFVRHLYILNLGLLIFVQLKGHAAKGETRWIKFGRFQLQPSEPAKVILILVLAFFLNYHQETIRTKKTFLQSFFLIAIPIVLILKSDLGTSLVIMAIWLGMVFMAGAQTKHILAFLAAGLCLFTGLWHFGVLKKHQIERIETFMNPDSDPSGAGYHVSQARIAIGSGGTWGKGLFHSQSVRGGFVPEKHTDFIFTTIGEELGFMGGVLALTLYGGILWRARAVVVAAYEDYLGRLMATGVVMMFAFHIIINIGMNVGIMPVTGIPLPFISAGGSNLLPLFFSIGILQSIARHRRDLLFG